jgi:ABC-type sugar transport systems, permease components
MKLNRSTYPDIFLLPAILVFGVFFIAPVIMGFYFSFTDWNVYRESVSYIGIEQFKRILSDDLFYIGLKNTFIFAVIVTVVQNVLAVIVALIANNELKTRKLIRTVFFMPCVLSYLIVGYSFSAILHPNGPFNMLLSDIGLKSLTREWIMDPAINIFVLAAINIWMFTGFSMSIYLAGMQTIPKELYEASKIDGANWLQNIRRIVLPLLAPSFTINIIMSLIGSLKVFELVYVTTNGGPGDASQVINTIVFQAFGQGTYGYATAISLMLFFIVCILALPLLTLLRRREVKL